MGLLLPIELITNMVLAFYQNHPGVVSKETGKAVRYCELAIFFGNSFVLFLNEYRGCLYFYYFIFFYNLIHEYMEQVYRRHSFLLQRVD